MNRLKTFFMGLDKKDGKYNKIYEGPLYDPETNSTVYSPIYWDESIGYKIDRTGRKTPGVMGIDVLIPRWPYFANATCEDIVLFDFLAREFGKRIENIDGQICKDSGSITDTGFFFFPEISNEIHERNLCYAYQLGDVRYIAIKVYFQLPVGNHKRAVKILCKQFPLLVNKFLKETDEMQLSEMGRVYSLQMKIRSWLAESEYCCFIANGSKLVNVSDHETIEFVSPAEDEIEVFGIKGMGIKRGVTVLTGSGYSGKSTMLKAISDGIYNHIPGDGKELVITDESAVYIAAEDGRVVRNADISMFMKGIPNVNEKDFSTDFASGSTSQASNVVEAIASGSGLLLLDEDRSAANFLIRDDVMRKLVLNETIVPLADISGQMSRKLGISIIIVVGGSSEFLYEADRIYLFDKYVIRNITASFREEFGRATDREAVLDAANVCRKAKYFPAEDRKKSNDHIEISELRMVRMGDEIVKADRLYNVSSRMQLNAIVFIVRKMQLFSGTDGFDREPLDHLLERVYEEIEREGLDSIFVSRYMCERWMEMPRKIDVLAFINRMGNVVSAERLEW